MRSITITSDNIEELLNIIWKEGDVHRHIHHHQTISQDERNLSVISKDPHILTKQIFGCLLFLTVIMVYVSVKFYTRRRRAREKELKSKSKSKSKLKSKSKPKLKGSITDEDEEELGETVVEEFDDVDDDISAYNVNDDCYLDTSPSHKKQYAFVLRDMLGEAVVEEFEDDLDDDTLVYDARDDYHSNGSPKRKELRALVMREEDDGIEIV